MSHTKQLFETRFGPLECLKGGTGQHLVWIHGEEGQRGWLEHHAQLASALSVWAPTLPGVGASRRPEWMETVPGLAKILLDALETQGIDKCLLGGASMGGWIAAEMASMEPRRFAGLVLAGSQGVPTGHLNTPDIFLTPYRRYIALGYANPTGDAFQRLWGDQSDDAVTHDLEILELAARVGFKPYMYDRSLLPSLARFDRPTLLVWGDEDIITPRPVAQQFKDGLAQAQILTVAGAGHYVHLEQPRRFAEAVITFSTSLVGREDA